MVDHFLPTNPTCGKLLEHCKDKVVAFRECLGIRLTVFKIGVTANPDERFPSYVKMGFTGMWLIAKSDSIDLVHMLEAALISEYHQHVGCRNKKGTGGDGALNRRDPSPPPYYVYVVGGRADQMRRVGWIFMFACRVLTTAEAKIKAQCFGSFRICVQHAGLGLDKACSLSFGALTGKTLCKVPTFPPEPAPQIPTNNFFMLERFVTPAPPRPHASTWWSLLVQRWDWIAMLAQPCWPFPVFGWRMPRSVFIGSWESQGSLPQSILMILTWGFPSTNVFHTSSSVPGSNSSWTPIGWQDNLLEYQPFRRWSPFCLSSGSGSNKYIPIMGSSIWQNQALCHWILRFLFTLILTKEGLTSICQFGSFLPMEPLAVGPVCIWGPASTGLLSVETPWGWTLLARVGPPTSCLQLWWKQCQWNALMLFHSW